MINLEQIVIALTGITAIWLTQQRHEPWKKYACIFGLVGQPFWLYATYTTEQWGIFILAVFYTYAWFLGLKNNWLQTTHD